jgi:signal transduction histidine kinase
MVDREVTREKRNEAILKGQSSILKKIIEDAAMTEILSDIIQLIEELEPEMKASILFLDEFGERLAHAIAPSLPLPYVKAIDGNRIGPDAGSCGTAAYTGKLVIVEDIATDPRWKKYASYALPHNLRACWSMPIKTPEEKVLGTFAMYYHEIRKPTVEELELLEFSVNLARLAIEKTRTQEAKRKYENMILEQNEELIKINKELDSFVYKASHDLRAPLSSILGLINLANKSCEPESELKTLLAHMEKSVSRLDDYIKELIDHSRNLRVEKETVVINFEEAIIKAIDNLAYMDEARNVEWQIHVDTNETYRSDKTRFTIIINNLIANAIRYSSSKQKPVVKINVHTTQNDIVLTVEDNGIGIESKNLSKIFDMFYRASESTPGSGLGLYIVKETIETLGGSIEVNSTHGKGTKFIVIVPNQKM